VEQEERTYPIILRDTCFGLRQGKLLNMSLLEDSLIGFYPDANLPCPRCVPFPTIQQTRRNPYPALKTCSLCEDTTQVGFPAVTVRPQNEIVHGLYLGGWDCQNNLDPQYQETFDTVYDVAGEGPDPGVEVEWVVKNISEGPLVESSWEEFDDTATACLGDWSTRKNILIRSRFGLNRAALVLGLVLVSAGLPAPDTVRRMRAIRSDFVLSNPEYLKTLIQYRGA